LSKISSDTYEGVEEEANQIWRSQRYSLVQEYMYKPLFAPPFVVVSHVSKAVHFILRSFVVCSRSLNKKKKKEQSNDGVKETKQRGWFQRLGDAIVYKANGFGESHRPF
jgi:hypothetical protein